MAETVAADADPRAPTFARRAVLPWRRRIRNLNDYDFRPRWAKRSDDDPFNPVGLVALPLILPMLVVLVFAGVEFVIALVLTPFALAVRAVRKSWPVEVLDRRGRLLERTRQPSWGSAGELAEKLRFDRDLRQWV